MQSPIRMRPESAMLTGGLAAEAFRMQSPMRMRPASAMAELVSGGVLVTEVPFVKGLGGCAKGRGGGARGTKKSGGPEGAAA